MAQWHGREWTDGAHAVPGRCPSHSGSAPSTCGDQDPRLTHCNLHERVPSHSSHWSWNECYHADGAHTEPTQSTTFTTSRLLNRTCDELWPCPLCARISLRAMSDLLVKRCIVIMHASRELFSNAVCCCRTDTSNSYRPTVCSRFLSMRWSRVQPCCERDLDFPRHILQTRTPQHTTPTRGLWWCTTTRCKAAG